MFTGLIRAVGRVAAVRRRGADAQLGVDVSGLPEPPATGASVAVSGVCLTATRIEGGLAHFDVSAETLARSTFATIREGARVNLEPSLRVGDALDGHFVLGHVDGTTRLLSRNDPRGGQAGGSATFRFALPEPWAAWVAEKGSVALDGVSLTVSKMGADWFEAALIPATLAATALGSLAPGDAVNFEADALARYAARWLACRPAAPSGLSEARLREAGF